MLRLEHLRLRGVQMRHGMGIRSTGAGWHAAHERPGVHLAAGRGHGHVRRELVRHALWWCAGLAWVVGHTRSAHGVCRTAWVLLHAGRRMWRK